MQPLDRIFENGHAEVVVSVKSGCNRVRILSKREDGSLHWRTLHTDDPLTLRQH